MINKFYYKHKKRLTDAFWITFLTVSITIIICCVLFLLYGAWLWLESWWYSQGILWFTTGYKTTRRYYKAKGNLMFWRTK